MSHRIHTYTELEQQIHEDLRVQHPEWVEPTGDCPECDQHEARLKKLLEPLARSECNVGADEGMLAEDQNNPGSP